MRGGKLNGKASGSQHGYSVDEGIPSSIVDKKAQTYGITLKKRKEAVKKSIPSWGS